MAFPSRRQMIFDVFDDLLADQRQRKQFLFNKRIVGLFNKFQIRGRLITQVVKPIMYAEHSTVGLEALTIHSGAFTRMPNA